MALPGLVRANNLSDVADKELAWNNLGKNFSATYYVSSPNFDANFASNKSLIDGIGGSNLITFDRASIGTFLGSNGVIQTAASGVPRFDHKPLTGESLGLLVEEARYNQLPNSMPTNSGGGITNTSATDLPGVFSNGRRLTSSGGSDIRVIIGSNTGGVTFAYSFWARLGTQGIFIFLRNGTGPFATWNISNGTVARDDFGTSRIINYGNGWYRCYSIIVGNGGSGFLLGIGDTSLNSASGDNIIIAGVQVEVGSTVSSYIPTSGVSLTRSADICSIISPVNPVTIFGQFIATNQGTRGIASVNNNTTNELWDIGTAGATVATSVASSGITRAVVYAGTTTAGTTARVASSLGSNILAVSSNGSVSTNYAFSGSPTTTQLSIGRTPGGSYLNSTLSRLSLWPTALPPIALRTLSASGIGSTLTSYQTITGKDILALNEVNKASARDFVFLRGLSSAIQPRITTASQNTASGVLFASTKLLDVSPSSVGNFYISSGSLNAQSLRTNGIAVASLSSVPFSGSTALFALTLSTLEMSSNFRFVPLFTSGVVSSPTIGVQMETNDFILYAKAGQN